MHGAIGSGSFRLIFLAALLSLHGLTGCVELPQSNIAADSPSGQVAGVSAPTAPDTDDTKQEAPAQETPTPETPAQETVKYHPGHYIALNDWDGPAQMIQAVRPGVTGIHKRYPWKTLEPAPGVYDFSGVAADLALAADHGMQLVVMIEDKSFSLDTKMTPPYLWDDYTLPYVHGGQVAKRWSPYVVERMGLLTAALGAAFDVHPNLEGIAFQESAMGFTPQIANAHGYTPAAYRDALIAMLIAAKSHFPRSQVFWYMNYLEGGQAYIGDIAEAVLAHGVAMGGPDVLPDSWPLGFHSYPYYARFKGRMTLFGSMQYDSYAHLHADSSRSGKYWTMDELFEFARDELHVDYVFWTRKPRSDPADSYNWTHALPVIAANPEFNR